MIVIVDYGVGNLFSLISSFKAIGVEVVVSGDKDVIRNADKILLRGCVIRNTDFCHGLVIFAGTFEVSWEIDL